MNFNLSIGLPVAVAAVPPIPAPARVAVAAPNFFYAPSLGFYVSMGGPVDIIFTGGNYYRYDRGYWYSSPRYNGHWVRTNQRGLPPELKKHRYEDIRYFRDKDYRRQMEARNHGHNPGRDSHRGDWRGNEKGHGEREARWIR
jgi:hypothetical protein